MDKIGKGLQFIQHKFAKKSYTPINTLDPNEQAAEKMRRSRSDGQYLRPLEPHSAHSDTINSLIVMRAGMVISGGNDGLVVLTNTDHGDINQVCHNTSPINKLCWRNIVGKHSVLTANRDKTLSLLMFCEDGPSHTPRAIYQGHFLPVTGVVNLTESQFMSGSRDCTVRLWDVNTTQEIRNESRNRNLVTHMAYSSGKNLVAQTSEDKSLKLWDPRIMQEAIDFGRKSHIHMYCEFSGENRIFSCTNGFNNDGCLIMSYDMRYPTRCRAVRGHEGNVNSLAVVQMDGHRKLLASVSSDKHIRLWKIEDNGEDVLRPLWQQEVELESDNLQVCSYPDGHIIVSGGRGRLIHYQAKLAAQRVLLDVHLLQKPNMSTENRVSANLPKTN